MAGFEDRFSRRHGFSRQQDGPLIHHDAPERLRVGANSLLHDELNKSPEWIRSVICGVRRVRPDPSNWSQYPNIRGEAQDLVHGAEWYEFYDFVEACAEAERQRGHLDEFDAGHDQRLPTQAGACQRVGQLLRRRPLARVGDLDV